VTAQDHNRTLIILHSLLGAFFTLGLLASPWIIAQNFSDRGQVPTAVVIFGTVFLIAVLFWFTAVAEYRRKPLGRKLALISAAVALPIFWPVGVYTWWFMHSEGAKQIYGVKHE
jgi:hypothetical protein